MKYAPLRLNDKIIFDRFLNLKQRQLSTYAFANIFVWKDLFKIFWVIIEDNLCVFFRDKIGAFLYLPPLGKKKSKSLIASCFKIMDGFNLSRDISRIENVAEEDLEFYRSSRYACAYKSSDYVYRRDCLFQLRGNSFKSKRAGFNYFIKHYPFQYEPYSLADKSGCMALYKDWMRNRQGKSRDFIYRKMLEDNFPVQKESLVNYQRLNLLGRIVKVNQRIRGYTLGFRLNQDTFCILSEIADLNFKGISQFIFRKFCAELKDYQYINIMDDSGLENLRRVKLSYRPLKLIPAYIVKRRQDV